MISLMMSCERLVFIWTEEHSWMSLLNPVEMALERNRDVFRSQRESSQRAQFLSSTLQQITLEHEQALQSMREKVVTRDSVAQALEQKLGLASDEVQKSHMGYRVLENRYTEEKAKRERYGWFVCEMRRGGWRTTLTTLALRRRCKTWKIF